MTLKDMLFGRKTKDPTLPSPADEAAAPERTGGTIGKYEIVEKIGAGGFGTVYKGWDPLIKRHVAIKTCEVANKDIRNRFFREAQLAGGLQHPNITMIYEFGFEGDVPYMVQEFLNGEDLDRMIKRNAPLSLEEKLKILLGVVFGLEYAHRAGVIHRDVKPANVRVLESQAVKIMDFGIAKSVDPQDDITQTGITVGSSSYMSPEQIAGDVVDFRTDIFSFGILAYELLSYRKPFRNENLFLLLEQIVKEEPVPLGSIAPDVPAPVLAIVERAMRKSADERFPSARELRNALVAAQPESAAETIPAVPVGVSPPEHESGRLEVLGRLEILDTAPEPEFDDLALLAARLCGTRFAAIGFVDREREWYKARVGISPAAVPRPLAFTTHALGQHDVLLVADAAADPRFAENPLVTGEPRLRFCAAVTVGGGNGSPAVGALLVLDAEPRELTVAQIDGLKALARQVTAQLELRRLRRSEREQSGEKLMMEVAGLGDRRPTSNGV